MQYFSFQSHLRPAASSGSVLSASTPAVMAALNGATAAAEKTQAKIKKYETFVSERLKPDLRSILEQRDLLQEQSQQ